VADRVTLDDFAGHVGCRHGLEAEAQSAIRTWFTTPIGGQTPFARLRTYLDTARPISGGWTREKVLRVIRSFAEDES